MPDRAPPQLRPRMARASPPRTERGAGSASGACPACPSARVSVKAEVRRRVGSDGVAPLPAASVLGLLAKQPYLTEPEAINDGARGSKLLSLRQ